ncbi:MAG: hypothetical protein JSW47_00160 [Phycisphaerales bacterium]|nr:MAG: hypothetical protein JSW47_00160 [Phycisphaerales bacterium]
MTIHFNCPNCDAVIAFGDKHIGKRARCTACGQRLIIPESSGEAARKFEEPEEKGESIAGFYRAVFVESWKLFGRARNVTGLVFVTAAVCFKFFTGHTDYSFEMGAFRVNAPTGLIVTLSSWGCLFWYYMEIIYSTSFEIDDLPDVYMDGFFGFIWNVTKSLYVFAVSMMIVLIPCAITMAISQGTGIVPRIVGLVGLFVFPMVILTVAVGRDLRMLLRPDYMLKPVTRAFWPYMVSAGLLVLAFALQLETRWYVDVSGKGNIVIGLHLLANLAVQMVAIVAMRSIGLFHRHYGCHFPW